MERFKVIGMNWALHYAFPVILVTIWFQRVLHLEPVFLMAKGEENGQKWILSANVSLFVWKSFISTIASMAFGHGFFPVLVESYSIMLRIFRK